MKTLEQLAGEVAKQRAKIIDDFCEIYLASRIDWFKADPRRLSKLELVEQIQPDGISRTYSMRVKKGRHKSANPHP
jgi:hypothetical protein